MRNSCRRATVLVAALLLTSPVWAALGGSADSVTADVNAVHGQLISTSMVAYDMQQISTGAVTVYEYVTRGGQVFAVTWSGPTEPNLQQLLGSYFSRVHTAALAAHEGSSGIHRRFTISQADLVMQVVGRLRSFHGIAYLPALVPSGVSIAQLQ